MTERCLDDKDAYLALKERDLETRYLYESMRSRQKTGCTLSKDDKAFIKALRMEGRRLYKERAKDGFSRIFEE